MYELNSNLTHFLVRLKKISCNSTVKKVNPNPKYQMGFSRIGTSSYESPLNTVVDPIYIHIGADVPVGHQLASKTIMKILALLSESI